MVTTMTLAEVTERGEAIQAAIDAAAREHAHIQYPHTAWDDLPEMDRNAMLRFVTPLVVAALKSWDGGR